MDQRFQKLVEDLHTKFEALIAMEPVTIASAPKDSPEGGVYLFSEDECNLYTGRTKRNIRDRLRDHVSSADDCPFAWHLAREATGNTVASYKPEGSRKHLLGQPHFKKAYEEAKQRIRKMQVRFVSEPNPLRQALLEIYVATVSESKFNDFDTH